MPTQPPL